jgi:TonB family protein
MGYMSSSIRVKGLPLVLQRLVQDPIGVSAIASLALHLPLLLFLPRLFSNTPGIEEPEPPSSVDVVELTPAEQQRVPDFQTPEIILPPLAQTPSSLSITPLPKFSQSSPSTTLPPLPSAPSSSLWGFGSSFQFPPIGNTAPTFTVPQTQTPIIPYIPPRVTVQQQPVPSAPPSPVASPSPTASPSPSPSPTSPVAGVEPVTPSPSPEARTEEQVNRELLARNQEIRDSLTFNEAGTGESDRTGALSKWVEEQGIPWLGADQNPIPKEIQSMNGSYPAVAGYRSLKGEVIVAILVKEDGKPASESAVTILQSSGYRIFDQAALTDALAYPFEATGKKTTYFLNVVYAPTGEG